MVNVLNEKMTVIGTTAFGRKIITHKDEINDLMLIVNDQKPMGVYVPYDIWFQIQHFIHTVIER